MECAGRGSSNTQCTEGAARRRCGSCGAVAYCSISHQISHWTHHKHECARLKQCMERASLLHDFPFTFSAEATLQVCERQISRCSFLMKRNLHDVGMWKYECSCGSSVASFDYSRIADDWSLPSAFCPCHEQITPLSMRLSSWKDYYEWRSLPPESPVALLLHWPLTLYHAIQIAFKCRSMSLIRNKLHVHYLGPEKELLQLAVFGELHALFPNLHVHIDLIGPAIPKFRDCERIDLCSVHCIETGCTCKSRSKNSALGASNSKTSRVTLQLHSGIYHEKWRDIPESLPHLIFAANAGIAAYCSWLPTIELIKKMDVPAIFSDYCEEAAHLAASCINTVTGSPLTFPIELNPFRQPMLVENSALFLPCYSNCFLFGMQ